ncbi:MAG: hypothetical protein GOVbin2066_20 [Prokaryotic dsDNA virus sp.]|nr:MAG: hypothetical protein GOVbin2066_20 [Prokaryotic dsDNA virus sp.]|tara:strand:- start:167 stop:592 length:426 start_codon:yes stop_codon:yes gene_type:complete
MGFDLHSIKKYPADAPQMTADYDKDKEKWMKEYEIKAKYDQENGMYFRNNIWGWRPLWNFVCENCDDILTKEDMEMGHFNDGYRIDKDKSLKIAERLNQLLSDGTVELEQAAWDDKDYPFHTQNVINFAKFCKKSEGFEIF